ncbi:DNAJC13 [Mytilus edulis]|uniref:DNAJC13 n=1 Tax=Mytilus edulis TaxID=6550 RepID=A0A8S3U327_MYTED|nr:DNAJC13 [Mytilus edulis]
MLQNCRLLTLESLFALMSNTKIVKEAMAKGAVIYLLDLFCNSTNPNVREKTAELLSKMLSDKLVGPKVRIVLSKFLPPIFMDAMRDSPEASVHMYEGTHENPELIWNEESRDKVSDVVKKLKNNHFKAQRENPDSRWSLREDFAVVYTDVAGELTIGGVFLRLFIANPGWVFRKPKEFLTELMEKWAELTKMQMQMRNLKTVTTAIVYLFTSQPVMLDQLPQLGYIPKVFTAMSHRNNAVPRSAIQVAHQLAHNEVRPTMRLHSKSVHAHVLSNNAVPGSAIQVAHQLAHNENNAVPRSAIQVAHQLAHNEVRPTIRLHFKSVHGHVSSEQCRFPRSAIQVAHQLAHNEICIRSMAQIECIGALKVGMKARRDSIALAAEALGKMFDKGEEELVSQALKTDLVPFLLKLLEAGLEAIDNPWQQKLRLSRL